MTVVLPKGYHMRRALEQNRVTCVDMDAALTEEIRALRIGILNIMPKAETYEYSLLHPLGRSVMQVEPVWIRLHNHPYSSTDQVHLDGLYRYYEDAIKNRPLDGVIVTGAPVEEIDFNDVKYWRELQEVLTHARESSHGVLGMCWGGLALAKLAGIEKTIYPKKVFGVFETTNLGAEHPIMGDHEDVFWCPQSRHSGLEDRVMEEAAEAGAIRLLAHAREAGYVIFESADGRMLSHLGHPEYEAQRLIEEYERDVIKGRRDVGPPANLDLKRPLNRWRSHRNEFFGQWIKLIHDRINKTAA